MTQADMHNQEFTRKRPARVAVAALLALLAACGGGSDEDDGTDGGGSPPPPPTEPVPTSGIPALVGDWVQKRCTRLGTTSARTLARFAQTGENTISYGSGIVQYASADCSGAGTALPPTTIASIQVTGIKTAPGIAAHWGRQSLITGIVSYTVLSKLSDNELCMIGDQSPSLFADAASVLQSINVSRDASCYDKR